MTDSLRCLRGVGVGGSFNSGLNFSTITNVTPEDVPEGPQVGLRRSLCRQIKAFQPGPIVEHDFALITADEMKQAGSMKP